VYKSGKPMGFWSAVSMGIGSMVGAGIFALLGEAASLAGSATYISFILGGIIALFSGYSLGKLGVRYPAAGGIVEYLAQSYGVGLFTGAMSIMLYISALVSLSLIAKAFGSYAYTFMPDDAAPIWRSVFTAGIVVLVIAINLKGSKDVALWERITVAIKFSALLLLAAAGILYVRPELLSTTHYPPTSNILYSLAITFFAFEGFRVITNAVEDIPEPEKTLPRAMTASILLVMALYIAVSFAVFGNLPLDKVMEAKEYVLAEAAMPIIGTVGFTMIAIAALISTASSINANLFAVTNVTYQLAKEGELPSEFGTPIGHSREGLLISGLFVVLMAVFMDLSQIAVLGSISILFVHGVTHLGHLRVISQTGASKLLVSISAGLSFIAMILTLVYQSHQSLGVIWMLCVFLAISVITEVLLQTFARREITPRTPE
jgi:amino acid transporter